jgi:hypothetical protein
MSASVRGRLRAAAAKYSTVCPMPHVDIEEAVELIDELAACVNDLTEHIAGKTPRDQAGQRDLELNAAYMKAMALLVRLDVEETEASREE